MNRAMPPAIFPYPSSLARISPATVFKQSGIPVQTRLKPMAIEDVKAPTSNLIATSGVSGLCSCGRSHFFKTIRTSPLPALPSFSVSGSKSDNYATATLKRYRPPRSDWYEELFASFMNSKLIQAYQAQIAEYKSQIFTMLKDNVKDVLEIGIGTGPNLKYYAGVDGIRVFGVDPNKKMEKYAVEAAETAGLSSANFEFRHAVGEALPMNDDSVDAVVGTLVLCSVTDVNETLQEVKRVLRPGGMYLFVEHVAAKDGTFLRLVQNILNPLQRALLDGCHLTRDTGNFIGEAGFSRVDSSTAFLPKGLYINPILYGVALK